MTHDNQMAAFIKKLNAKMGERQRLHFKELTKLVNRYNNVVRDLNKQHNTEAKEKAEKYYVVHKTHSACRFEHEATNIFRDSDLFETTRTGGNSRMSWTLHHKEDLNKSLKTLAVENVTQ